MTRLIKHVALISESERVRPEALMPIAAALQKQAARDLAPVWDIEATVDAFSSLDEMPVDYWPILIRDDIGYPGAGGIHLDNDNQPFALVRADENRDSLSLTCSHELCEMLVDPFGNRLVAGASPKAGQGRVAFLVEVCDPSEGARYAYRANGVAVSDFYTPHFFDPVADGGVRYSFTGAVKAPRSVLPDGYLSWMDPASNEWWQMRWFGGPQPTFLRLGKLNARGSLRSAIDILTAEETAKAIQGTGSVAETLLARATDIDQDRGVSAGRADRLRACVETVVEEGHKRR